MTTLAPRGELKLRASLVWSALLHLLVVAAFLFGRTHAAVPTPPTYRVTLIAAPAGPRQVGVVTPEPAPTPAPSTPSPPTPAPATPAPRAPATPEPERMKAPPTTARPVRTPKTATPNAGETKPATAKPAPAQAPRAGGGPVGGRGADVANVRTEGIEFPFPVYLQNVVRQIALQFKPPANSALRAEVSFLIRRDGSVSGLRLVTRSGSFSFDQDAMGAVEAASRSFGPLPQGFTDDVLPVIFSFDPRLIR
ncbi:MAG: TonB C-terminal domain-containing protein [Gemmatimonadaceae bacterium]